MIFFGDAAAPASSGIGILVVMGICVAFVFVTLAAFVAALLVCYRCVGPQEAIVRSGFGGTKTSSGQGLWVIPLLHTAQQADLTLQRVRVVRRGNRAVMCRNEERAEAEIVFTLRVGRTSQQIEQAVTDFGAAADEAALEKAFGERFETAIEKIAQEFGADEVYANREEFKARLLQEIGDDLNGYVIENCAIDHWAKPFAVNGNARPVATKMKQNAEGKSSA